MPPIAATDPTIVAMAATRGWGRNTHTTAARARTATNPDQPGPKWLWRNSTADGAAARATIAAIASRPSQSDRSRHAHSPPRPINAAIAGASATV